jgi:hypothetical protein
VVAVLDRPLGSLPNTVRLVSLGGIELSHAAVDDSVEAVAIAGHRVLLAGQGRIRALDIAGEVREVERYDPSADIIVHGLIASPDGGSFLWSTLRQRGDGMVQSRVLLGGDGRAPAELLQRVAAGRALAPVLWSTRGPVLSDEDVGIGGYILFRRVFGEALLLNVASQALRSLSPTDCALSDASPDGTIACVSDGREGPHRTEPVTLHVIRSAGSSLQIAFDPAVRQAGAAYFSPDGRTLSLASSAANADPGEVIISELVDVDTGARHPLSQSGLTPVGWSADGTLVADRIAGAAGGPEGTYTINRDGGIARIAASSIVVGVGG